MTGAPPRPTPAEVAAAVDRTVPDLDARRLRVLFCGINPGLYSAATGHHFARPGNRFWPALHLSGFTPRVILPAQERALLALGIGITNLVRRATASAAELTPAELKRGRVALERKVRRFQPACVARLGIGAYRAAFERPRAALGRQRGGLGGVPLWVLPNPSGLNAHHQLPDLARVFGRVRRFAMASRPE